MVRLITHNMLTCHVRNCTKDNFPLQFNSARLELRPTPEDSVNLPFLRRFIPKLEYEALVRTCRELGIGADQLPDEMPKSLLPGAAVNDTSAQAEDEEMTTNKDGAQIANEDEFLQKLWKVLMEVHVEEGSMVCRGCGHIYPIQAGIPNMLLAEHEVSR